MPTPEEAVAALRRATAELAVEWVAIEGAAGRVLADDVRSRRPLPGSPRAAMDGFYLHPQWARPEPYSLPLVGRVPAGHGVACLPDVPGTLEVATGTALSGEGAVVPRELVREEDGRIIFPGGPLPHLWNVRRAGEELAANSLLARAGERLGPWQAALIAAAGVAWVPVRRRARARLLVTGDELAAAAEAGPESTVETHSFVLAAVFRSLGLELVASEVLGDDAEALERSLQTSDVDLLVSTGGASVGRHDWVGAVAQRLAAEPLFEGVAMRPGGPTRAYRLRNGGIWLALPGNPLAVAIGLDLFLTAWWRKANRVPEPRPEFARLRDAVAGKGKTIFLRGRVETGWFRAHRSQSSASLRVMVETDSWAVVPPGGAVAGERVLLLPSSCSSPLLAASS